MVYFLSQVAHLLKILWLGLLLLLIFVLQFLRHTLHNILSWSSTWDEKNKSHLFSFSPSFRHFIHQAKFFLCFHSIYFTTQPVYLKESFFLNNGQIMKKIAPWYCKFRCFPPSWSPNMIYRLISDSSSCHEGGTSPSHTSRGTKLATEALSQLLRLIVFPAIWYCVIENRGSELWVGKQKKHETAFRSTVQLPQVKQEDFVDESRSHGNASVWRSYRSISGSTRSTWM